MAPVQEELQWEIYGKPPFAARCLFVDKNYLACQRRGLCLGTRKV